MHAPTCLWQVNIDDDLFEQDEAENTSSELVFDEFEEVVARIFNVAVFLPMKQTGQTANLLDQDGDGDLDDGACAHAHAHVHSSTAAPRALILTRLVHAARPARPASVRL